MKKQRNASSLSPEDQQIVDEWLNLDDEGSGLTCEEREKLLDYSKYERMVRDSICDNVDWLMEDCGYSDGAKSAPAKTAVKRKR